MQPPRIISWNVTSRCLLRCPHCYIDAAPAPQAPEAGTGAGMEIVRQVADAGTGILVLSGGEPLLREDIFRIASFGDRSGLRMALATSGIPLTGEVADNLASSGIRKVAISLDSVIPENHDRFRGLGGAWAGALRGIGHCRDYDIPVQLNVTVTPDNRHEIVPILRFAKSLGIGDVHLFFLVPTGRGQALGDLTPGAYEAIIREALRLPAGGQMVVRPTCAPQYMRIAEEEGLRRKEWQRGCIAGRSYLRISPAGEVTPCPYLPVSLGNVLATPLADIWEGSGILGLLRDDDRLQGKCGACEYRGICGGCRARAYGSTTRSGWGCADLHPPGALRGNLMAEEPMCPYIPAGK